MDVLDDDARSISPTRWNAWRVVAALARDRGVSVNAAVSLDTPSLDKFQSGIGRPEERQAQVVVYVDHDA
jgi:hypothetical protein